MTACACTLPPYLATTLDPIALRFDFVPTRNTLSQFKSLLRSFRSKEGGSFKLMPTMSTSPSLSKSPKAQPRLQCAAEIPGPASSINSSNFPLPRFLKINRGVFNGYSGNSASTSGKTDPVTTARSGQPLLSKSPNPVPQQMKRVSTPKPAEIVTSVKLAAPSLRYSTFVSSEKWVLKISRLPSRL